MDNAAEMSPERCSDVWYDDGNVVLQAEHMLFKIYLGILQAQSPFFRDMFTLPQQDSNMSEKYEDCPLVVMQGDRAADVRVFLKALLDSQFYADVKSIKDIGVVLGVLKISHKYQVEYLVRRSVPTFTALYPPTLQKWDIRQARRQWAPLTQEFGRALPIFVVNIARSIGADILLPSALFECCGYTLEEIIAGVSSPSGVTYVLNPHDQLLVLHGRGQLAQFARTVTWGFIYEKQFLEAAMKDFPELWARLHRWVQAGEPGHAAWRSPLARDFPWADFYEVTRNRNTGFRFKAEAVAKNARNAAWAMLPTTFGLPTWDKLRWKETKE